MQTTENLILQYATSRMGSGPSPVLRKKLRRRVRRGDPLAARFMYDLERGRFKPAEPGAMKEQVHRWMQRLRREITWMQRLRREITWMQRLRQERANVDRTG